MTTNEQIKCPVCGEEMEYYEDDNLYRCITRNCIEGTYALNKLNTMSTLIQSRIDKEKAAAVIAERERVIKWLDRQMLTDVSGLYNRGYDEALVDVKIYLEEQ